MQFSTDERHAETLAFLAHVRDYLGCRGLHGCGVRLALRAYVQQRGVPRAAQFLRLATVTHERL